MLLILNNYMQFFEVIKNRHSVRSFLDKPVEEEKIRKILEIINSAPSAGNLQSYKVILIKNKKVRDKLTETSLLGQDFIGQAPVVLVFLADLETSASRYRERGQNLYCLQDATIACAYAQLAASDLGLGSCWIGAFNEEKLKKVLGIEKKYKPVAILPIGYPAIMPESRSRKDLSDLVEER